MKVTLSNQEVNIGNIKSKDAISIDGKSRKLYPYTNDIKYFIFKKEKYFVLQKLDVWSGTYYFPIIFQYKNNKKNFTRTYWSDLGDRLQDVINKYKDFEVEETTTPSGPDTSKFVAVHRGDISYVKNYTNWGGQYSCDRYFTDFVKIGTAVKDKLPKEFWNDLMSVYVDAQLTGLTLNKRKPVLDVVEGSAFFGVGFC